MDLDDGDRVIARVQESRGKSGKGQQARLQKGTKMKKLMLTAAAAAMAAGAFADMPAVYDYKATVKHMYLKEVNATVQNFLGQKQTVKVYQHQFWKIC